MLIIAEASKTPLDHQHLQNCQLLTWRHWLKNLSEKLIIAKHGTIITPFGACLTNS